MWNAHIDSFVVHARRLADVLADDRQHADDLVVSDLVQHPPSIDLPVSTEYRARMNKRVLHLTTQDDPETIEWPIRAISQEIGHAMDSLIDQLEQEGSPFFQRFARAREGGLGFQKAIMLGPPY